MGVHRQGNDLSREERAKEDWKIFSPSWNFKKVWKWLTKGWTSDPKFIGELTAHAHWSGIKLYGAGCWPPFRSTKHSKWQTRSLEFAWRLLWHGVVVVVVQFIFFHLDLLLVLNLHLDRCGTMFLFARVMIETSGSSSVETLLGDLAMPLQFQWTAGGEHWRMGQLAEPFWGPRVVVGCDDRLIWKGKIIFLCPGARLFAWSWLWVGFVNFDELPIWNHLWYK